MVNPEQEVVQLLPPQVRFVPLHVSWPAEHASPHGPVPHFILVLSQASSPVQATVHVYVA